jgi:hypothetical protein
MSPVSSGVALTPRSGPVGPIAWLQGIDHDLVKVTASCQSGAGSLLEGSVWLTDRSLEGNFR